MDAKNKVMSRRLFLGGLGAAFAAPHIIPATALGADGATAPSERIHIGVVGTGSQAKGLTENAIKHKNTRIVALCDVDKNRVAEAKGLVDDYYGDQACATHGDFRELLARDDIDAVIVATPDHWHALVCIEAARRGKDIYCEKPLTWSLGEGRAVVKAVQENKRVFQVGSMQRSGREFKQACELVRNGYLGQIRHILVALPNGGQAFWADEFPRRPGTRQEFYVGPAEWTPFTRSATIGTGAGGWFRWRTNDGLGGSPRRHRPMAMDWDHTGPVEVQGELWEPTKERNNLYNARALHASI